MKSIMVFIASIVLCTGVSPPKPTSVSSGDHSSDSSNIPILPPVLPPPPNNCSGICTLIYSPVCSGPIYGCGELVQSGNLCQFNYFNCVNLIKTGIPYEVKYKGQCYATTTTTT